MDKEMMISAINSKYEEYKVLKQSELMDYMKWYYNNI